MFDKGQLAGMMKKFQEMQKNLEDTQQEVAKIEVEGQSGAGLVKITMTGKHDIKKVTIDDSLLDDKEMLEDLLAAAVNDGNRKIEEQTNEKMGDVTAGMPPGMGNLASMFK